MKHIPRKRFGQNFLQDQYIIEQIIQCINPQPDQTLLEIGPGLAALTKPLLDRLNHLDVIELDRDIISFLRKNFTPEQLTIHEGDALKFDYSFANRNIRVIGNLPYNISTPLLFHLATFANIQNMTFMLQKEVVDRICAKPNTSDYGKLSVMLQYKFKCRKLLDVPPESFFPAPKIDSAIVYLEPRTDYAWSQINETNLQKLVSQAFSQRRKTINNTLKGLITNQQLAELNIDPQQRAENLSINDYLNLLKYL